MANPSANLRVRISADLADIKQGMAVLRGELAKTQREASKPLPANNPVGQLGVSAGQTAAAMRQLPAQFTDIVTSLQGGMPVFTVLLQQGGQIRDSFGGAGAALRGVGQALIAMINPFTVAAAAVGGLTLAWKQAADAQFEFDKALITTGNASGKTREDLQDLVGTLDTLDGVTRGGAADAVLEVAKSGRFAGEQFDQVAAAAARMEGTTGQAIDVTVDKFKDLAKDPVDALLKLNETEHFLTQAQLERVRALEDEGREQEAVAEAVRIYSEHLDSVAQQANEAMPAMSRWWRDVKDEVSSAAGEVETYIRLIDRAVSRKGALRLAGGRELSYSGTLGTAATTALPGLGLLPDWATNPTLVNALAKSFLGQAGGPPSHANRPRHGPGRTRADEIVDSGEAERQKELEEEWDQTVGRNLDKEAQKRAEINAIRALGLKLGKDEKEIAEQVAAVEARYADKTKEKKQAKTDEQKAAETLQRSYESMVEQLERQVELHGDASNAARVNYEIQSGSLKGITDQQALYLRQLAAERDLLGYMDEADAIQRQNDEDAAKSLEKRTDAMSVFADEAARNIQGFLGDGLYQMLDGRFSDIGDSFEEMLKRMGAELAASQILKGLMGTSFFSLFGSTDQYTGFAEGGYTGAGGVNTPAGIVHKGEVVWSQRDVARAGGVGVVEGMRRGLIGYAAGGVVGMAGGGGGPRGTRVEIVNNGAPARVSDVSQDTAPDGSQLLRLVLDAVADDLGSGGRIARVGKARYGWRDVM